MNTKELRKEIRGMIKKDSNVKNYISKYEELSGISYRSKLTPSQLNDIIFWCINEQLVTERNNRNSIGGLLNDK